MKQTGTPILVVEDVQAAYGPVQILNSVSLHIDAGEIVALIGANGAGKSTLLFSLFGAPPITQGSIRLEGEEIRAMATHQIARKGVSLVPEGRRVFSSMTVEDNLIMGAVPVAGRHADVTLEQVMTRFPILRERRRQRAGTLSGGEQQMLAIGRALMSRPRLLLLDEPSLGLAPLMIRQIFEIIQEIAQSGTTIFLVEQNANQALQLADRGYVLAGGQIPLSGTGLDLLHDPQVRKAYLGGH